MHDPKENLTLSLPTQELERRWAMAREVMRDHKIDYLLMRNEDDFLGGYIKWFSDFQAHHGYPRTVIFPRDEKMTLIGSGPFPPGEPAPPTWAVKGVKQVLNAPYFPSIHFTHVYDAELAVGVLKEKKDAVIGLVGKSYIPTNFYEYLAKYLPGAKFVEMTEQIDQIKVIKSQVEIELIRATAAMQDEALEEVGRKIKPGMRNFEVSAEAERAVTIRGSERQLVLVGSAPKGVPAPFLVRRFQNRMIQEGDQVSLLIEVNGPGGLYTEIARIFSIGEPSQQLVDAFSYSLEAQQHSLHLIKPGAQPGEILSAHNEFLRRKKYKPELRIYAHGQGHDLVERPLFIKDETMTIQEGMNITVHPTAANDKAWGHICDNYLIGPEGPGECLHKTPKEIIIIS